MSIDFPLLADPASTIIRSYGVLNREATGQFKGMARPGYFFVDPHGVIREKFFEAKYRDRLSGNNLIAKLFPDLTDEVTSTTMAPHLELRTAQSDQVAFPGERVTLTAEVTLPTGVHVYAPGTKDYKPIGLTIDGTPGVRLQPVVYPRARILYLAAINERVPVFAGTFRIREDVEVDSSSAFSSGLGPGGRTTEIAGTLQYQACDRTTCFLPASVPVRWRLQILPLDRQRAPESVRHK